MAILPAADLGLMAEHLSAHEGITRKLHVYEHNVTIPELQEALHLQRGIMLTHVKVMLALINPDNHKHITLPSIEEIKKKIGTSNIATNPSEENNKWITLEAHSTANSMANKNFTSALMMKDKHVHDVHVKMALQQVAMQEKFTKIINKNGWSYTPKASYEEQLKTYQKFKQ